ncbi:phosphoglycolate phosphatase [Sulfitobacter marinus]|uniref:phosphoglycolate phosphatase n=1 Tax=Sulfitobacter marinus TaxID=394264 RepID=A0A1I6PLL3_9RHOB|nr:HAD family hydrolase [Sulfitobacter marinus]SFS41081.1 phosphoglycolate phosphatase [Sulfitobacter marinus]
MTVIKGILFDKDGTLFDFATTWEAWAHAFLTRLTAEDTARASTIGAAIGFDYSAKSFAANSVVIAGTPKDVVSVLEQHLPEYSQQALIDLINEEAGNAPQIEVTPLVPFLTGLKAQGLHLGVATNDAEEPALAHLDSAGATHLFDFVAGFDSGFGGKPAPGQLLGFARHVALDPAAVAMIGDSTHDLLAAEAAGMLRVGVLTGMASADDLAPFADVVLPNISHLPDWINSWNSQRR